MTKKQKYQLLDDCIFEQNIGEFDGKCGDDFPKNYRGLFLQINDHGNITLYNCYKNGNVREIASRV